MTAVTLTADGTTSVGGKAKAMVRDSVKTVIAASMVGTAIEFYDFRTSSSPRRTTPPSRC